MEYRIPRVGDRVIDTAGEGRIVFCMGPYKDNKTFFRVLFDIEPKWRMHLSEHMFIKNANETIGVGHKFILGPNNTWINTDIPYGRAMLKVFG